MEYKSTIKSRPYLYKETKKAVSLINKGLDVDGIKGKSLEDNIFQLESEARKKEVASIITSRIKGLDPYILDKIENSNIETSKILVLYAIAKTDRLFFEFLNEVYKEKIVLKDFYIRDKDFSVFFQSKKEQSEKVDSWSEYTFKKLKQVYIRILFESGLIGNQKGDREIVVPIIDSDVKEYLYEIGSKPYADAILGID
ncbi:DUF1819 family protein [Clostridium perfringens]|uniref:Inner membrane protein n=1 Tax=Clostridium perfringens D str. JGS1721 TaxID=488537 RepID=B1UZM2_CLOPF|nr:DUF1819 family protein [Clostridium perfringens]EDT73039.1 conserved hypothetical protein [Clostridium perfringens D str. JGS1721]MBI6005686.1 DUF1819 family protein [Clostridium perfringens]MDK0528759.1 DUF1819 family protein [Clostridium perfringens]MDK0555397.1 DUF1819 family protein [Clostridium perfringens]MDK0746952.1 DUF1819 family protein [Clostridium perfringens]